MRRSGSFLNPHAAPYIPLNISEANRAFITGSSSIHSIGEPYLHNPLPNRDANRNFITETSSIDSIGAPYLQNPLPYREANRTSITDISSVDSVGEPYFRNPPLTDRGDNAAATVAFSVNILPHHGSVLQHSDALSEVDMLDRQFNQDMEFLQANFSELSEEFLTEVYLANEGDLEASVHMIDQLQSNPPPEHDYDSGYVSLPDSLGIGDTSESFISFEK